MEMQNDSRGDDLEKRSRFYQALLDVPILKSGKETKYRDLPFSVIIFITQDDIWKEDLAKYTFTEQCEEAPGLRLNDGTAKIFLNMTGKNGSKELVSLLRYMKDSRLDNPEILIKDERIVELDRIVREVKESEEWEAFQMDIMEYAMERGIKQGIERGIEQGIERGIEQGKEKLNLLNKKLLEENRIDDLKRSIEDEGYQKKLYEEFGL